MTWYALADGGVSQYVECRDSMDCLISLLRRVFMQTDMRFSYLVPK